MKTIMTIAAGVALGYFAYQYFVSHSKGKISGRLHKSTRDKKVAGVCGGLAEYLGIDPTIIRLAWALLPWGRVQPGGAQALSVCELSPFQMVLETPSQQHRTQLRFCSWPHGRFVLLERMFLWVRGR